ncbi:hypothetical protein F5Y16DRAFT_403832 [Xylariaceae sp. FL0255]|nr:hypothetical protein F5Y16DRAFT_403832 [Xylariaceae sp. FL0255]
MAKAERVLRLSGHYHRKEGVTEEYFHKFSRYHAVACAKIHEKYGILRYQIAYSSSSAQSLAESMKTPYQVNKHDLEIEYYFKDVANLQAVSADDDFKALHLESEPYVYLDNGKVVNLGEDGESLYGSYSELSDIKISDQPVAKYYEE